MNNDQRARLDALAYEQRKQEAILRKLADARSKLPPLPSVRRAKPPALRGSQYVIPISHKEVNAILGLGPFEDFFNAI